ncbi:SDR family NAD(P)-dependent oxidoreductase [Parvibaculum sp.]|jgi:NAD(P)-dependent dehydrogenase (short-subunit alcohol dehydrogenase family)|uniref:SDR family NAD(P)-dependent oxidoreductase n=1 Tax=Parvibaculum sp. TaxID=2024848 RepID=UPI000C595E72|nr:SDR family NAD(P)-dependent oxidoreductase [Parvibaculum sp.]MAM93565.1 oxidoreductase [Parvibaculum sp.]|tara:strand:+ start:5831 stop:6550 length:720 start_codon:yes stop_codon:yes gene_type:complete
MSGRLQDRLAVITGASRGIGRAVALGMAAEGAHVILVARTVGALEEVDDEIRKVGGKATLVPFDLTDLPAIDRLGANIFERWGKLDVFVGNAGMLGTLTPLSHMEPKDWDKTLAVNVTANWRMIRSFEPLLKRSDAGRAIFVTSGAAHKCKPYWGGYSITKAALDAMMKTWAAEVEKSPIRVNSISPGPTRTAMRKKAMPGEDPTTLTKPADLVPLFIELALPSCTKHGEIIEYAKMKA